MIDFMENFSEIFFIKIHFNPVSHGIAFFSIAIMVWNFDNAQVLKICEPN